MNVFYEIELKALLSSQKYAELDQTLPKLMSKFNEETLHTTRYRPGDLRLRHSSKTTEIVCKEGDPTKICRKEIKIDVKNKKELDQFAEMFSLLGLKPDPIWIKHKQEFKFTKNGYEYVICLQDIKDFAYILEIEHLSEKDDSAVHEPNLRAIAAMLGCQPIEPEEFSSKIKEYISKKNKI